MKKLRSLKKGLAILLTAVMVVGLMPGVGAQQVSAATATWTYPTKTPTLTWEGSGTAEDPYIITTAQELANMSYMVNAGLTNSDGKYYYELCYKLGADIDIGGKQWVPIGGGKITGYTRYYFWGSFDGDNHTIRNLTLTAVNTDYDKYGYSGLFYGISHNVEIKNVKLENVNTSMKGHSGALVAYISNSNFPECTATISNCHVLSGTITSTSTAAQDFGGLIGGLSGSATITNCTNRATVTGSSTYNDVVGGIIGYHGSGKINISNCYNYGALSGIRYVGGIVGSTNNTGENTTISNCGNEGSINSQYYVGGIVGKVSIPNSTDPVHRYTISGCYNKGAITSTQGDKAGGIVGQVNGKAYVFLIIERCYNAGTVTSDIYGSYNGDSESTKYGTQAVSVKNCVYTGDKVAYYGTGDNDAFNIKVTAEELESGKATVYLNQGLSEDNLIWYQNLSDPDKDNYPVTDSTHSKVYASDYCMVAAIFSNTAPATMNNSHNLEHVAQVDAKCGISGLKEHYKCNICGELYSDANGTNIVTSVELVIPPTATEHNHVDGICTVCGDLITPQQDADGYYLIYTLGELISYADMVTPDDGAAWIPMNEPTEASQKVRLMADIDMSSVYNAETGKSWNPIGGGDGGAYFKGDFDGNGHTISGLYINSTTVQYAGLFGRLMFGVCCVHDLTLKDVSINAPNATAAGTVAGFVDSYKKSPTIKNCMVEGGTIIGKESVGGIAGKTSSGQLLSATEEGDPILIDSGYISAIQDCGNKATVTATTNAGGLSGSGPVWIDSSYNSGTVTGATSGQITSSLSGKSKVNNCYYLGTSDAAFGVNSTDAENITNVAYKSAEEFASGEVAYLLQGEQENAVWGQTLGEVGDAYPVLGGTPVYRNETYAGCEDNKGEPTNIVYSNTEEDAVYAEHTDSDEDGKCDYCGRYIGIIQNKDYPTEIAYCNEAVTPLESNFTINSGAAPLTFTWYKGDLTTADKLPTEGDDFIGITAPAKEGVYTLVVTAPAVEGETSYTAAELRLKIEIVRVALTGSVKIGGTVKCGETLTVDTSSITNVKTGTLSYQWYYVDGDTKTAIDEATNTTYTLTGDDVGKKIAVEVTSQYCTGALEDKTETAVEKIAGTAAITSTTQSLSKDWDNAVVSIPTFTTSNDTGTENANVTFEYKKSTETEYVQTAPSDAGTYHVRVRVAEDATHGEAVSEPIEFTISKVDATVVTVPKAATGLTYHGGEAITLIDDTGVHVTGGEIWYALGAADGTYSKALPTATDAGEYQVYYKVVGDNNHNDTTPVKIDVTVEQATPDYTIPTDLTVYCGDKLSSVTLTDGFVWTDDASATLEAGDTESGQTVSKTAKFVPTDKKNYIEVTDIAINIKVVHTLSATQLAGNEGEEKHTSHCSACEHDFAEEACSGGTATCKERAVCSVCNMPYGTTDANNHTGKTQTVNAKDATCKEDGYTGDIKCLDCGEIIETGSGIPKLSTHTYANGVCSVCDKIWEETIHGITYRTITDEVDGKPVGKLVTVSGNDIPQVAVAVTGTDDTLSEYISDGKVTVPSEVTGSGCEQTFVVTKISENAFKDAEVTEIVVPATVTEVGSGAFGSATTITFNGSTVPDGIAGAISEAVTTVNVPEGAADSFREALKDVLGENVTIKEIHTHTFDTKWSYDATYHWHAATCKHTEEIADQAEHTFGIWVTVTEATEDAEGVKERSCCCGYKETAKIDKLAHTTHVKDNGTRVEPTCEKKGSITYKCTKCDKVMEVVEIPSTGHKWDAGKVTKEPTLTAEGEKTYTCSVCGATKTEVIPKKEAATPQPPKKGDVAKDDKGTGDYKVTDVTKKEVAYQTPADQNAATICVPATVTIGNVTYKVTSIADNAFANNKKLTKVTIGSNITTIGKKAFYKCTKLKTVKIGKNVTTIGASAFYGCSKLTTVTMGSKVTTISDKAFYKCTALTKITIPSKVKKIGKQAFYGCKKLKSITIKTTKLTSKNVGSKAFKGIYAKATIKVPKSKVTSYKKILKAKGVGSKAKIKK